MIVTLDIDDAEVSFFIKLAKSLQFVNEIKSEEGSIEAIPGWHLPVVKERLENIGNTAFVDTAGFISALKN
jgi:hypothetical protein